MCGICGIVHPASHVTELDRACVARMTGVLRHRGPDGHGVWVADGVALGHSRLSITDLPDGHQPMVDETSGVAVTCNGGIYNFVELRSRLEAAGHVFRTRSDSEVIVRGYAEWGESVVDHLRGAFAFALWDGRRRRLVLARDRYGEKPLYYGEPDTGGLMFASEIKALLEHPGFRCSLDAGRLAEYLAFRSVSGQATLFQGVRELPPASVMVVDATGARCRRYWSPEPPLDRRVRAMPELVEEGRRLLVDAVRVRLESDVGLGTITSGGLDSSLVTAIVRELVGEPFDTFCVGLADAGFDERPYARQMAEHLDVRLHEVEVSAADMDRELDMLTYAHDEPLTHPNSIPMHLLYRYAREQAGIKVLLSGEGADELFGGYDWYRVGMRRERLAPFAPLGRLLPERMFPERSRLAVLRRVMDPDYLLAANAVTSPRQVGTLGAAGDALAARRPFWPSSGRGGVDGLFVYDQLTYLPPLLHRQDRMSMAAGVEARVAFLDHHLAEWANGLPAAAKIPGGRRKELLKRIAERWVPAGIRDRRKVGFTLPLGDWLRRGGALHARIERLREPSSYVRSLLDGRRLDALLREHDAGVADHADVLWSLVALDAWAGLFHDVHRRRSAEGTALRVQPGPAAPSVVRPDDAPASGPSLPSPAE